MRAVAERLLHAFTDASARCGSIPLREEVADLLRQSVRLATRMPGLALLAFLIVLGRFVVFGLVWLAVPLPPAGHVLQRTLCHVGAVCGWGIGKWC